MNININKIIPIVTISIFCLQIVNSALADETANFRNPTPGRTAIFTSTGVNNDRRSWNEYDDRLNALGWKFDKVRNTDIGSFWSKSSEYDFLLTTSLWNYADSVDMTRQYGPLLDFMKRGGVVLLTDMSYQPMCDWLRSVDSSLYIDYEDANKILGTRARLASNQPCPILRMPNSISSISYWAHFPKWGAGWIPMLKTQAGSAVMLGKQIGKGALIVTTGFALDKATLENVYVNAKALASGYRIETNLPTEPIAPGYVKGSLTLANITDTVVNTTVASIVKFGSSQSTITSTMLVLEPGRSQTIPLRWDVKTRGKAIIGVAVKNSISVACPIVVPPLLALRCNRYILARGDTLIVHPSIHPPTGAKGGVKWHLRIAGGGNRVLASGTAHKNMIYAIAASKLGIGRHRLVAEASCGGEHESVAVNLEVRDLKRPPTICRVGPNGELLVNGRPLFMVGTYHVPAQDLAKMHSMGFNCTTGPIFGCSQSAPDAGQKQWMKKARNLHLFVLNELSDYPRNPGSDWDRMVRLESELRLDPTTLIQYAIDEPTGGSLSPEIVSRQCALLKECDPEHPTFVQEVVRPAVRFASCGDMAGTDPYPIGEGIPESLAFVANGVGDLVHAAKGRPVIAVLQSFRQPPPESKNRYPTIDEVRCMAYLALNHGAKGLLFYAWADQYSLNEKPWSSGFIFDPALMASLPGLIAELKEIGPDYVMGKVAPIGIGQIDAVRVTRGRHLITVAINPTSKETDAKVPLPGGDATHHFKPFETWICREHSKSGSQ